MASNFLYSLAVLWFGMFSCTNDMEVQCFGFSLSSCGLTCFVKVVLALRYMPLVVHYLLIGSILVALRSSCSCIKYHCKFPRFSVVAFFVSFLSLLLLLIGNMGCDGYCVVLLIPLFWIAFVRLLILIGWRCFL